jgi:hypothetical protein
MRDFSEYGSLQEIFEDAIAEGIFPRNRKIRKAFPGIKNNRQQSDRVERFKSEIVRVITETSLALKPALSRSRLYHAVRGDNQPQAFNAAVEQLIAEQKISAETLQTKGRPYTHYHPFEF